MPTSYDFKNDDTPPKSTSSSYKTKGGGSSSTQVGGSSDNKDKKLSKVENCENDKNNKMTTSSIPPPPVVNGSKADPDEKWRSNYVPSILDFEKVKNSTVTAQNGKNLNSSLSSPNNKADDELDAKWKMNYVPTSYDIEKVQVTEGDNSNSSAAQKRFLSPSAEDDKCSKRGWSSKAQFVFACFGLSIGVGNVVRFPYLIFKYGGGAFLLPYVIFLVLVGMPLYFLELGIGQYSQLGPLNVWKCASVMQGVGFSMIALSVIAAVYYNQIMAYCLYYIFASFAYIRDDLPWSVCGQPWNTNDCYQVLQYSIREAGNVTILTSFHSNTGSNQSSAYQYFHNRVLHTPVRKTLTDDIGAIRWDLALCLLLSWVVVFLVLLRGSRGTGRAAYFITTLPCLVLLAIMIRGVLMEGATLGLTYLFVPRWEELASVIVWRKALEQVLFSLSVSYGSVIMYGSYCSFRNKAHYDAIAISIADLVVSIIASIGVFSILGAMAHTLGVSDVTKLPDIDLSLAFMAFPSAISGSATLPHLWAILFFLALYTLGLSSLAGHMHSLIGAVQDTLQSLRRSTLPIAGVLCASCFLLGLPLCAEERGYLIFSILNRYGIGVSLLVVAVVELFVFSWVYGVRRVSEDFSFMLGYSPSMYWKVCWAFVSPVIIIAMLIASIVEWEDTELDKSTDPSWGYGLRWGLVGATVAFIPLVFIIMIFKRLCTKQTGRLFSPALSWGPGDPTARRQLISARDAGSSTGIDNLGLSQTV